jgi:hypothetical protein
VGRIPDNEEFRELGMERFCRHVDNYEDFETVLLTLLGDDNTPLATSRTLLQDKLASSMIPRILIGLNTLNNSKSFYTQEVSMLASKPQTDLVHRLAVMNELKPELSPATAFTNYRTLSDVIGFYAEFWGLDLFHRFSDIMAAQGTICDALQFQALELLYRQEPLAACTVARRAMEVAPDNLYAAVLYADLLRRTGKREEARAICLELLRIFAGSDEAKAVLDMCDVDAALPLDMEHYHLLHRAHATLRPNRYIEIGISSGRSLALTGAGTSAIGVDPMTAIPEQQFFHSPAAGPKLFKLTSNDFFQQGLMEKEWGGSPFDMAFIDGLHLFEQALMDFVNLERRSDPSSVIFIHDCLPVSVIGAERQRRSMVWTGDVWKVIPCLKAVRPDLEIITFPVRPSGLAMVRNLDRRSKVLSSQFNAIAEHFVAAPLPEDLDERFRLLNVTETTPQAALDRILALQGTWQRER